VKTVADFKKLAVPGSVWQSVNLAHPGASGTRTIIRGSSVLSYAFKNADGKEGSNGRLEMPKSSEVQFDEANPSTIHFLVPGLNGPTIGWSWTLVHSGTGRAS